MLQIAGDNPVSFSIYAMDGRLVMSKNYTSVGIDISELNAGQYVFVGTFNDGTSSQNKFVVY